MLKDKIYLFLVLLFLLSSCSTTKTKSIFVDNNIKRGLNINEFISLYEKPYKKSFYLDEDNNLHETLYYKEEVYKGQWYIVTTVFQFKNSILISQEQLDEERKYLDNCKCNK